MQKIQHKLKLMQFICKIKLNMTNVRKIDSIIRIWKEFYLNFSFRNSRTSSTFSYNRYLNKRKENWLCVQTDRQMRDLQKSFLFLSLFFFFFSVFRFMLFECVKLERIFSSERFSFVSIWCVHVYSEVILKKPWSSKNRNK